MSNTTPNEPRELPDCPTCDAVQTLKHIRADFRGHRWVYCDCCSKTHLLDADGRVLHKGV
jgi:hypothetical protein